MAANQTRCDVAETVAQKYEKSLIQDMDAVFHNKNEDTQNEEEKNQNLYFRKSQVLNAAQAYEEKLDQLFHQKLPEQVKNIKRSHKEWRKKAVKKPATPTMKPKVPLKLKRSEVPQNLGIENTVEGTVDEKTKDALYKIANELLSTEETYVSVLHLLDQVFYKRLLRLSVESNEVPEKVINTIFQHLSAIYLFHSTFLLPQLKARIDQWDSNPQIGDIMTQAGPFLKMYGLYVENLDRARATINTWLEKSTEFSKVIKEIHELPECKSLPLQEHMLVPVQRTPRYEMLLKDFAKKLPEASPMRDDVETALQLIVIAANHSNEFMKTTEKSLNLVKIYNNLAFVDFDTEDMTRTLIKEGAVTKVAARDGKGQNRYLYLFSDMLLCCKECVAFHKLQGKNHKIAARIDLFGMTTASIDNKFHPNVFCVHGVQKSIEFSCNTPDEKDDWLNAINKAIKKRIENENSFRRMRSVSSSSRVSKSPRNSVDLRNFTNQETNLLEVPVIQNPNFITLSEEELGTRAPHWIKDQDVTMCMRCSADFHVVFRRRHHCRACGWVVCSGCSNNKIALPYDSTSSLLKVCDKCFAIFSKEEESNSSDEFEDTTQSDGISLCEANILSDNFHYAEDGTWISLWCIIPSDEPFIYCYKARRDVKAHLIVNLPGSHVTLGTEGDYKYFIKIYDSVGNLNVLATDEEEVAIKWSELITQIIMEHEERDTSSDEENVEVDVPRKT